MSETPLSADRIHRILADGERRRLIRVLAEESRCLPMAAVVQRVAEATDGAGRSRSHREIRIRLHHDHLPRLAAADLVEYGTETSVVRPTTALHAVAGYADLPEAETPTEAVLDGPDGR